MATTCLKLLSKIIMNRIVTSENLKDRMYMRSYIPHTVIGVLRFVASRTIITDQHLVKN